MKHLRLILVVFGLALSTPPVFATKIHECEDEQGNRTFQKTCPPGSTSLSSKEYSSGKSRDQDEAEGLPSLVLYAVPDCEVCDLLRNDLSSKKLSVTEKNIKDNGLLQQELKSKTGGDLRVPVLLIGDKVVAGYNQGNLVTALKEAGFEIDSVEPGQSVTTKE